MEVDDELYQLCKSVYEKTGWSDTPDIYLKYSMGKEPLRAARPPEGVTLSVLSGELEWRLPAFTSDYLLEKLQNGKLLVRLTMWKELNYRASSCSDNWDELEAAEASTPVKALLKLTLALKEAGELL